MSLQDHIKWRRVGNQQGNKVILRVQKLKTAGAFANALRHNIRDLMPKNADPSRSHLNEILLGEQSLEAAEQRRKAIMESLVATPRKDAVLASEYVIQVPASVCEMSEDRARDYLQKSLDYVVQKHGEENVLQAAVHLDEESPHMHVLVVPKTDRGTLSHKEYFGGRVKLSKLQTDFHTSVAKDFGVERGTPNSSMRHMDLKEYYGRIAIASENMKADLSREGLGNDRRNVAPPDKQTIKELRSRHNLSKDEALVLYGRMESHKDARHIANEAVTELSELRKTNNAWSALKTENDEVLRAIYDISRLPPKQAHAHLQDWQRHLAQNRFLTLNEDQRRHAMQHRSELISTGEQRPDRSQKRSQTR